MSDQKTVLVTGANKGIGYEIVRQLLAKGFRVFLTARNAVGWQKSRQQPSGRRPISTNGYIGRSEHREWQRKRTVERKERLDVLINNAAIYPDENLDILTISRDQLVKTFQTNTFGPIRVTQAFLPFLKMSSRAADNQHLQRLRRNGWSLPHGSKLLPIEAGIKRRHNHVPSSASVRTASQSM